VVGADDAVDSVLEEDDTLLRVRGALEHEAQEERFAQRPNLGVDVDGLFKEVAKLQRSTDGVPGDIDELERRLAALKVSYRVFSSNVIIRAAKWGSEAQDATP